MEGPIFGGAYVRREICVIKSVGLNCSGKEIYHFCFCFTLYSKTPKYKPPGGAYIRRGDLTEGFLRYDSGVLSLEGLIHGGILQFRNFTIIAVQLYLKANRFEFPLFWVAIQC